MIFFFKKKPVVLTCVTKRSELLELAPVQRTSKFIPEWWKNLPNSFINSGDFYPSPTMKSCTGFLDLYSTGATVPMWSDLALVIGPQNTDFYRYQFADHVSSLVAHNEQQYQNHFDATKFQHLKINSPWKFVCNEDIKFLVIEPTWSFMKFSTIRILPGMVEYKYQATTNINMFVERMVDTQEILIPFLEPVMQIIPLTDRPFKIINLDDQDILKKASSKQYIGAFMNGYGKNKKSLKSRETK